MTRNRKQWSSEKTPPLSCSPWLGIAEDTVVGIFLLLLLLVFRLDLRDHFALPKLVVLQAGTLMLWLFVAIRCSRDRCRRPSLTVVASLTGLVVWWVLSTITAVHIPTAIWGNYGRYQGLSTHLILICLFLVFLTRPSDAARTDRLLTLFVLALAPVALYAVAQYAGYDVTPWIKGENRSASTMGQPVLLAAGLAMGVPPLIGFVIRSRGLRRTGWIALLVLLATGSLTALSRGPLVGLACSLVVFALLAYGGSGALGARGRILAVGGVAMLLALLIVLLAGGGELVARRMSSSSEIGQRLIFFKTAARIIADNPFDGVGFGNFSTVYPRYRLPEDNLYGRNQLPTMVHNGYLQTAVSSGIPALFLYLALVGVVIAGTVRVAVSSPPGLERIVSASLTASLSGYLIQDLTGWFDPAVTPLFWVFLGIAGSLQPNGPPRRALPSWVARAVLALIPLALLFALTNSWRLLEADRLLFEAGRFERDSGRHEIESRLAVALEFARGNPHYSEEAALLSMEVYSITGDRKFFQLASELFAQSAHEDPHNPYSYINRLRLEASALRRGGGGADALGVAAALERIPAMDPNNPSGFVAVAEYHIARGEQNPAASLLEKAAALRPLDARESNLLADAYRSLGRYDEAQLLFKKAMAISGRVRNPSTKDFDDWIASSYGLAMTLTAKKEYWAALAAVGEALKKFPDRTYSYNVQAAIYEAMGDRDRSRMALARFREGSVDAKR